MKTNKCRLLSTPQPPNNNQVAAMPPQPEPVIVKPIQIIMTATPTPQTQQQTKKTRAVTKKTERVTQELEPVERANQRVPP